MLEKEYNNHQYIDKVRIPNLNLKIDNYWSPHIEKELLKEIKSPNKNIRKAHKLQFKSLCILLVVTALLSLGMCVQADTIIQTLQEIARNSVKQTININQR